MTLLICEDCGEFARVTVEPYGGGKMAVYNCPKCGESYETNPQDEFETRTDLTHAEQLEKFGWCLCEGTNGEGHLSKDCPR